MADWVRACAVDDIDDQDLVRWDHEGRTYAIYRTFDGFYCTDGICTHRDEPLEAGILMGHVIECPLHQAGSTSARGPCSRLHPASDSRPTR